MSHKFVLKKKLELLSPRRTKSKPYIGLKFLGTVLSLYALSKFITEIFVAGSETVSLMYMSNIVNNDSSIGESGTSGELVR